MRGKYNSYALEGFVGKHEKKSALESVGLKGRAILK
jgi:hypothetical protein